MKTFRELRESILLNEIEALTHKKKIAAAQSEFNKAAAAHAKAADVHNDEAAKHSRAYIKAMRAKGHKGPVGLSVDPPSGGREHPSYHRGNAHKRYFNLHHDASKGNIAASHRAAMGADRHAQHVDDKHDKHAIKLHNNMVDAHHKLQAAKKASPLHKAKSAIHKLAKKVGVREDRQLDELSPELLTRYTKKAIPRQFKKHQAARDRGHDYMTGKGGDDVAKRQQKDADKRKKGIDSVQKRGNPADKGHFKTGKASRPQGGLRPGKGSPYHVDPAKLKGFGSKYLDQ
tara:strand:+ start:431 stop:1291 length:861 start_codon:yes stop_codon:yes gene_type:complete